ncbi:LOW QUALITY PROTEIN: uncharacterized protein EMH_0008540 [Eimeria mitis]|uniref:Uncharacterized protein n=1 Tax=Eimeria mitis TaxID=44415 RepID=U6K4K1_9EIME|nr:LOW QUALITY PROTEIN: uncharacterized protein EMH_0008540 [Eimeria mitis]CDJ31262.1 hypothetical protein, conserved [Eimeria mitis]
MSGNNGPGAGDPPSSPSAPSTQEPSVSRHLPNVTAATAAASQRETTLAENAETGRKTGGLSTAAAAAVERTAAQAAAAQAAASSAKGAAAAAQAALAAGVVAHRVALALEAAATAAAAAADAAAQVAAAATRQAAEKSSNAIATAAQRCQEAAASAASSAVAAFSAAASSTADSIASTAAAARAAIGEVTGAATQRLIEAAKAFEDTIAAKTAALENALLWRESAKSPDSEGSRSRRSSSSSSSSFFGYRRRSSSQLSSSSSRSQSGSSSTGTVPRKDSVDAIVAAAAAEAAACEALAKQQLNYQYEGSGSYSPSGSDTPAIAAPAAEGEAVPATRQTRTAANGTEANLKVSLLAATTDCPSSPAPEAAAPPNTAELAPPEPCEDTEDKQPQQKMLQTQARHTSAPPPDLNELQEYEHLEVQQHDLGDRDAKELGRQNISGDGGNCSEGSGSKMSSRGGDVNSSSSRPPCELAGTSCSSRLQYSGACETRSKTDNNSRRRESRSLLECRLDEFLEQCTASQSDGPACSCSNCSSSQGVSGLLPFSLHRPHTLTRFAGLELAASTLEQPEDFTLLLEVLESLQEGDMLSSLLLLRITGYRNADLMPSLSPERQRRIRELQQSATAEFRSLRCEAPGAFAATETAGQTRGREATIKRSMQCSSSRSGSHRGVDSSASVSSSNSRSRREAGAIEASTVLQRLELLAPRMREYESERACDDGSKVKATGTPVFSTFNRVLSYISPFAALARTIGFQLLNIRVTELLQQCENCSGQLIVDGRGGCGNYSRGGEDPNTQKGNRTLHISRDSTTDCWDESSVSNPEEENISSTIFKRTVCLSCDGVDPALAGLATTATMGKQYEWQQFVLDSAVFSRIEQLAE